MTNELLIPSKIKVGYVERSGTYSGKLAYIIYQDYKGVWRKEPSWNSWRSKSIDPTFLDNVPTEGFVLNKKVGGCSTGWNHRQTYTRVWDPRGFEFEITVENLLYILEWSDCLKGKGLEGKFVYSWSGKDLVLLPVIAPEYKESVKNTEFVNRGGFKKSELVPGQRYSIPYLTYDFFALARDGFNYKEGVGVYYIGEVRVSKGAGKRFTTVSLVYCPQVDAVTSIKSLNLIKGAVPGDILSDEKVDEVIHRFQLTPWSVDFWTSPNKIQRWNEGADCILPDYFDVKNELCRLFRRSQLPRMDYTEEGDNGLVSYNLKSLHELVFTKRNSLGEIEIHNTFYGTSKNMYRSRLNISSCPGVRKSILTLLIGHQGELSLREDVKIQVGDSGGVGPYSYLTDESAKKIQALPEKENGVLFSNYVTPDGYVYTLVPFLTSMFHKISRSNLEYGYFNRTSNLLDYDCSKSFGTIYLPRKNKLNEKV